MLSHYFSPQIEIKMRKVEGLHWTALEAADDKTNPSVKHFQPDSKGSMY